jgi:transposase
VHTKREEEPQVRLSAAVQCIEEQKRKWGLPAGVRVVIVYEAGQDGFWIARALQKLGYEIYVTDPASVVVSRAQRRAKTDRLDAIRLVNALRSWLRGERDTMRMVHMPTQAAEAQRQWSRERGLLQKEVAQHRDRMRKLLRTVGCWQALAEQQPGEQLEQLRCSRRRAAARAAAGALGERSEAAGTRRAATRGAGAQLGARFAGVYASAGAAARAAAGHWLGGGDALGARAILARLCQRAASGKLRGVGAPALRQWRYAQRSGHQ